MATQKRQNPPEASRSGRDQGKEPDRTQDPNRSREERDRENPRSEAETDRAHDESNRDRQSGDPSSRQRR